jgi:hypothetical protein
MSFSTSRTARAKGWPKKVSSCLPVVVVEAVPDPAERVARVERVIVGDAADGADKAQKFCPGVMSARYGGFLGVVFPRRTGPRSRRGVRAPGGTASVSAT